MNIQYTYIMVLMRHTDIQTYSHTGIDISQFSQYVTNM